MRTTRYSPQPQKGRQEVTVIRIYEATMMRGRELERQAKFVSQRGNLELARKSLDEAKILFNAAQDIRALVRIAEAEFKLQSYQQVLNDIDVLIKGSKSSQNVVLDAQKQMVYEKIQSLTAFLQKMREGLTPKQIEHMKQSAQDLWNKLQGV